ncbi:MAG: CHAP domain-containing protein, partial [Oscillospiraceae bacterium]|nr:CHAP domain-containing protein [Oscillospiraceae bacterium]
MVKEFSYAGYSVSRNKRPAWHFVLIALAALVVFITTYLLILPAFTMERVPQCGLTEHTHVDLCYEDRAVLVCEEAETEGHAHGEGCYEATGYLCGLEESEGHGHSQACYEERPLLICELEESEEHTHGESCFGTELALACGLEEAEGHTHSESCGLPETVLICEQEECEGHVHGEDCYVKERTLVCAFPEHTHTDLCYEQSNPEADLESAADWERTFRDVELSGDWNADVIAIAETQLGYKESTRNFLWSEAGEKQGYSRYGDWYGIPYGDWCAMFASFCLHYAEVPSVPTEETPVYVPAAAGCEAWVEQLDELGCYASARDTIPEPGDIVFFDFDSDPTADHVGLVYGLITDEESGRVTALKTIEGNWNDCVCSNTYDLTASALLGYGRLPQNPEAEVEEAEAVGQTATMTRTYEGEDYTITVHYTEAAKLPETVELTARELTGQEYEQKLEQARIAAGLTEVSFARFFDITFLSNGQEIEPNAPVEVVITYHDGLKLDGEESGSAVHFTEDGPEVLDVQTREEVDGSTSVTFEQGSFSTTGTVYGVSLLAEDDGIAAYAEDDWSAAPPVGNLTGKVVQEPVVGEWYILYGYNGSGPAYALPESWPNRGSTNQYGTGKLPTLSQAGTNVGDTVKYVGTADMAWQYVGDGGFVNRYGYYMYATTTRTWSNSRWNYTVKWSVATNPPSEARRFQYNWDNKSFYTNTSWSGVHAVLDISNDGYSDLAYARTNDSYAHSSGTLNQYLAQVTNLDIAGGHANHPPTSVTGNVTYSKPVLYNIDATKTSINGLAG